MVVGTPEAKLIAARRLREHGLHGFVVRRVEIDGETVTVLLTSDSRPLEARLERGELVWLATGWPV